jgi:hypothetical protein
VQVRRGDMEVKVRLRTVAKPDKDVAVSLSHLGLRLPSWFKTVQNVVEKNGEFYAQSVAYKQNALSNCGTWVRLFRVLADKETALGLDTKLKVSSMCAHGEGVQRLAFLRIPSPLIQKCDLDSRLVVVCSVRFPRKRLLKLRCSPNVLLFLKSLLF